MDCAVPDCTVNSGWHGSKDHEAPIEARLRLLLTGQRTVKGIPPKAHCATFVDSSYPWRYTSLQPVVAEIQEPERW